MKKCKLRLMIWVSVICLFLSSSQGIYAGELIDAAKQGDLAKAKTQIEARGAKVDETGPDNTTPLIWASYNGHLDVVKYLLVKGADINHKETGHGKNALMLAAEEGHLSVVKLLIEKKANVSAINNYGGTSLMAAAQNGHLNIISVLLSHGSKIDHKGNEGQTALMLACGKGNAVDLSPLVGPLAVAAFGFTRELATRPGAVFSPGDFGQTTPEKLLALIQGFSYPEAVKISGYGH